MKLNDGPAVVYRCYAADGELLYVGHTADHRQRMYNHKKTSAWYPLCVRTEVEWYDTRTEARRAEAAAILAEQPSFNQKHKAPQCSALNCAVYAVEGRKLCAVHETRTSQSIPQEVIDNTFSSIQVVAMVPGLTYRMLDHWIRSGYFTAAVDADGSGSRRRFSQEQVDHIGSVIDLRSQINDGSLWSRVMRGEVEVTITEKEAA